MRIITLMEDTCGNPNCESEHGLSIFVETKKHKLFVDTGAGEKTWWNAKTLGVDLTKIDTVVLSHGHYDHSGGIMGFHKVNSNAPIYMQRKAVNKYYHDERYIGIDPAIQTLPSVQLLNGDFVIDDELSLFANINGRRFWPQANLVLSEQIGETKVQDCFEHEQCLVIQEEKTVLISGCAHNGILNILDRYEEIYHGMPDVVISGFHMMKKIDYTKEEIVQIQQTAKELVQYDTVFYTGHCTGQKAIDLMKPIMGEQLIQIHSGMEITCR